MTPARVIVTALVIAALCGIAWFGRDLAVRAALAWLSDGAMVADINGSIFTELRLGGIELQLRGTEVRAAELAVDPD